MNQIVRFLRFPSLVPYLSPSGKRPRRNQRRTKERPKNSDSIEVRFVKINKHIYLPLLILKQALYVWNFETFQLKICTSANFVVPSNICLGFNPNTIPSSLKPFCSPVRLSPAIGLMSGAHYQSSIQELLHLVATFAKCSPYSSSLTIIHKNAPVIHYPTLRFQASLSEWWVMDEIDGSIFFMNNCSLYLRMCIFCCTFAPVMSPRLGRMVKY